MRQNIFTKICSSALLIAFIEQSSSATQLQGRIEEIVGDPNLKLPVALQATQLRLQLPPDRPRVLPAELKSLPSTLRGEWKGNLTITQVENNPQLSNSQLKSVDAPEEQQFIVGSVAESNFKFFTPRTNFVTMSPPMIRTPTRGAAKKVARFSYICVSNFDAPYWTLTNASTIKPILLKNTVQQLTPATVELDNITQLTITNKTTGKQSRCYEETVCRFTKMRSFELQTEVAQVGYDDQGNWQHKIILAGDLH